VHHRASRSARDEERLDSNHLALDPGEAFAWDRNVLKHDFRSTSNVLNPAEMEHVWQRTISKEPNPLARPPVRGPGDL
jgi:hypothetical protein